jgi:hypothetical protein
MAPAQTISTPRTIATKATNKSRSNIVEVQSVSSGSIGDSAIASGDDRQLANHFCAGGLIDPEPSG